MHNQTISSVGTSLLEFMMLYHRKFAAFFHLHTSGKLPLNKNQKKVLLILKHHRGVNHTFLSRGLDLQKGSLTSLIDSLEMLKLVKRKPAAGDRREVHLFLTEKGEAAIETILAEYRDYLAQLFSSLSPSKLEQFQSNITEAIKIIRKIEEN